MKKIRTIAESHLKKHPHSVDSRVYKSIEELVHELQVHEIELEMRNDELRASQEQLEESRSKYVDLFDFAPVSYFVLDNNGLVLVANLTACAVLGVERKWLLQKPFSKFIAKNSQESFYLLRDRAQQSNKIETAEMKIIKKNGESIFAQVEILALRKLNGEFIHYRLSLTDVTQQHLALEKERELNLLKSDFVMIASHEFRTPLSGILSSATLIGKYQKDGQQTKRDLHIERIKSLVKHLTDILQDFLSLEKIETKRVEVECSFFQLAPFVEELIRELQGIKQPGQFIHYQQDNKIKEVYLDKKLLKNIFVNLFSNALKYSPVGASIQFKSEIKKNQVCFSLQDPGFGIPELEQKHIFSRFFRAQNVMSIPGTGLGLSIVEKYVALMGGKIHFESKLNQGTTFFLEFPT